MHFRTAPQAIWDVYMLSVVGLSLWRGQWAERIVAFGMIADSVGSAIFQNRHDWAQPQWGVFTVDVLYLVVVVVVALRSGRWWPLWAAAFQLLIVTTTFAKLVDPRVGARAHFTAGEFWSYLILLAVAFGCVTGSSRHMPAPTSPSTGTSAT